MLPSNQLLAMDCSNSDDDEHENRADAEVIIDEDIQSIRIGGHTASVQVSCCSHITLLHLNDENHDRGAYQYAYTASSLTPFK